MNDTKQINFEQSIKELERVVAKLEDGDLSLEESLQYFEQGILLTKNCQQALTRAEQKIKILTTNNEQSDLIAYDNPNNTHDDL